MNPKQLEYFRQKLLSWREELVDESRETLDHLKEENWQERRDSNPLRQSHLIYSQAQFAISGALPHKSKICRSQECSYLSGRRVWLLSRKA